jgi:BioD-like phosphotransacetylase family protein
MVNLYIASKESSGKTTLCAGIGKKLLNQGKKAGYFLPVTISEENNGHEDITLMKEVLELDESPDVIAPFRVSSRELWKSLTDNKYDFVERIKINHARIAGKKDSVVMEGLSGFPADSISALACYIIAETLDARVLVVVRYSDSLAPSDMARAAGELGQRFLGVVVNFAPEARIETIKQSITASFQKAGIKLVGVLPEVRSLLGLSVRELAEVINGEIVTCPENADEIVENLMLGAMSLDSGIDYYSRKKDKAALIRGERPDMQLAALQTSTRCLVLTSSTGPLATVVLEAESKHIPIVVTKKDTQGAIADIERALANRSFHSDGKLKKLDALLDKYLDMKSLNAALGL